MKKGLFFILLLSMMAISCVENPQPTADQKDQQQQERMTTEAQRQAGMPAIHNYQEKKLLKMIFSTSLS